MAEWGRKRYLKSWPSRKPLWTIGALLAATLVFASLLSVACQRSWNAADGLYWKTYVESGARGNASARSTSTYTLLEGFTTKGRGLFSGPTRWRP